MHSYSSSVLSQSTLSPQPLSTSTSSPQPLSTSTSSPQPLSTSTSSTQPLSTSTLLTSSPQHPSHPLSQSISSDQASVTHQSVQPGESSQSADSVCPLDQLLAAFVGTLSTKQVTTIYDFSGCDVKRSSTCLLSGPTLTSILEMVKERFEEFSKLKIPVDFDDMWADMVAQYKSPKLNLHSRLRVILDGKPSIDTGGVRRQVYSSCYKSFA